MSKNPSRKLGMVLGLAVLASAASFGAVLSSNTATVALSANLPESLTISVSPSTINFGTLTPNSTNNAPTALSITTTWTVASTRANVYLNAWFATPTQAMAGVTTSTDAIPSSAVFGSVNSGTYTAFTGSPATGITAGEAGGTLNLFTVALSGTNRYVQRTDTLGLQINLTGVQVPADSYTGTLNIEAQAL